MTTLLTMKGFNKQVTPITTAGIYHSPDLGLISLSSDGTNWITIADKNLGATQVYNDGDTLSEANAGKYYQWGNNYGFPFTGSVTTSSTQVDASNYGPGNYYSSSTFITGYKNWSSVTNDNLWGDTTNTNDARRGPCVSGFHVPSWTELNSLYTLINSIGISTTTNFSKYCKIPLSGAINASNGTQYIQGSAAQLWSSTPYTDTPGISYSLYFNTTDFTVPYPSRGTTGANIRPFANTPVQPDSSWTVLYQQQPADYLCFTANTAGSTITLTKYGSPTVVTLETSTDGVNWSTYTFGNTITLSNIGDKVYWRNTSDTNTGFSTAGNSYYIFAMSGSISASGDATFLINKNGTDTILKYAFYSLFNGCSALKTAPSLPATTIGRNCYYYMFLGCTNLETLPKLPATTLQIYCYQYMFSSCEKIKLSATQTGEYQTAYRIPITGTGTTASNALTSMFSNTGGTFTGTPTINTTYYTSNTVV